MNILILDTETTGTGDDAECIEVACALFSLAPVGLFSAWSALISRPSNEAEAVNGISEELLRRGPLTSIGAWGIPLRWFERRNITPIDAVVSHGAEFDLRLVPKEWPADVPWVCSMDDIEWPRASTSRSLASICLAHGVGVEAAHRAIFDVLLLARLFTRVAELGVDLEELLRRAMRPKALFVVADRSFSEERNRLAKEAGFRWDRPEAPRQWSRKMFADKVDALPFAVVEVT